MTVASTAVFSAREVVAFREPFRPWDREFHDPGVAQPGRPSWHYRPNPRRLDGR